MCIRQNLIAPVNDNPSLEIKWNCKLIDKNILINIRWLTPFQFYFCAGESVCVCVYNNTPPPPYCRIPHFNRSSFLLYFSKWQSTNTIRLKTLLQMKWKALCLYVNCIMVRLKFSSYFSLTFIPPDYNFTMPLYVVLESWKHDSV